jgi:mRNA degradation ribonuclease J1/J2
MLPESSPSTASSGSLPSVRAWPSICAPRLEEIFVIESGDVLEIDHHGARRAGKVTVGRVCIDSGSVDDVVEEMVIRDRKHLSEDGIVLPIIAINRQTGRMESLPEAVRQVVAKTSRRPLIMPVILEVQGVTWTITQGLVSLRRHSRDGGRAR